MELALCLPFLTLVVLGSVESANIIFVKQALVQAAYEGVREAVREDGNPELGRQRAFEILTARGIQDGTVSISPTINPETPKGTLITVTVTAPRTAKAVVPFDFLHEGRLESSASMNKE